MLRAWALSCAMFVVPASGADTAVKVLINSTSAVSGESIKVSWADAMAALRPGVDLASIPELRTSWVRGEPSPVDGHEDSSCLVVGNSSYWLGQFSPALQSLDAIHMTGSPQSHGTATEGTPPYTAPAPVKFISGTQLARGDYNFIVTNMRATVNWVLFEGSLTNASDFTPLAMSDTVVFTDAMRPMHGRLARTSSVDEMRVSWTSSSKSCGDCAVQWGLASAALTRSSGTPATSTYSHTDLCGMPANNTGFHDPGTMHTVVLSLAQDSREARLEGLRYYYRFGSDTWGWSGVQSFVAPKPPNPHAPMSIIATADMGETYEDGSQYHWEEPDAINTTKQIATMFDPDSVSKGVVDVILHPGDLAYATGYESEWDRFMEQLEPLASRAPYMTGQGNHERDFPLSGNSIGTGDSGGECGVPTQARFEMPTCAQPNTAPCVGSPAALQDRLKSLGRPGLGAPSTSRTAANTRWASNLADGPVGSENDGWYSFDQGSVHFVMLNTEMSSANWSRQHQFVDADLGAVDRSATPWVLVFGHRQMYSGNMMIAGNEMADLEPLLLKHKVDIAIWGHIHFAQRSCPMYKAKCVTTKDAAGYDAPIHAVVGNAGQSLTILPRKPAPWSVYNAKEWGWSHIAVSNATHLRMDYYGNVPLGVTPPIHHSFDIVRAFPRV